MVLDLQSGCAFSLRPQEGLPSSASRLTQEVSVRHECCHSCEVLHEFGNAYRCKSSGQLHICDSNCNQKILLDNYTMMCRISRRCFPTAYVPTGNRKRTCSEESADSGCGKRAHRLGSSTNAGRPQQWWTDDAEMSQG